MIPNKIIYKPRWECVSFLSRAKIVYQGVAEVIMLPTSVCNLLLLAHSLGGAVIYIFGNQCLLPLKDADLTAAAI
jgi:hypothetical protein